jgi:hypothetical protein
MLEKCEHQRVGRCLRIFLVSVLPNLTKIFFSKTFQQTIMTSANHASQETTTLLPMSTGSSSPAWRSSKLLWATLAAVGVALSVVIFRSTSIPFSQKYENPAAREFNYDNDENGHKVVVVELEGKKKKSKHHKAEKEDKDSLSVCEDGGYCKSKTNSIKQRIPNLLSTYIVSFL